MTEHTHWWIQGAPVHNPPKVQILLFWHTNFSKHSRLGSWHPPTRWAPPYRKSWIHHWITPVCVSLTSLDKTVRPTQTNVNPTLVRCYMSRCCQHVHLSVCCWLHRTTLQSRYLLVCPEKLSKLGSRLSELSVAELTDLYCTVEQ